MPVNLSAEGDVLDLRIRVKSAFGAVAQRVYLFLRRPRVLRPAFALLRRFAPILKIGKYAVVSRYLDVVDVLGRDADFTVSEVYGPNFDRYDGPFILGLDSGKQYKEEAGMLHRVVLPEDHKRIKSIVREEAARQIAAAWPERRIDVVNDYARVVAVRVASRYFGVPAPDAKTMAGWLRDIFWDIFLNLTNNESVRDRAQRSGKALRAHLDTIIAERKAASATTFGDDVLGRMLALQNSALPCLDDTTIRRNLTGMIVGTVDFTSMFLALSLSELFRRPKECVRAREAALAGDSETVRRYIDEAARFDPSAPLLARYARREVMLAAGTSHPHRIAAGTMLVLGNISAMFDPDGFEDPTTFDVHHDASILHFGSGLHRCLGSLINGVQLAELASALLVLSDVRLPPKSTMQFEGPFPNRLLVEFA